MTASRPVDASQDRRDGGLIELPDDTWNTSAWIARHRAMSPAERIEAAVAISRAALDFARARRVAPE